MTRHSVVGALLGAIVAALIAVPAKSQSSIAATMPGIVIVDPAAGAASSPGRAMARQLAGAGYATVVVASDPLAAAASLRQQPNVRSDDIGIIGYGTGASAAARTAIGSDIRWRTLRDRVRPARRTRATSQPPGSISPPRRC
jgi:dienelactone hydrolase